MSLSQQTPRSIEIVPLTLHIGAEIRGVDLTKPLPPEQLKEVRDAFLKWKVVFFRGQHLDHAQHVAMARQFGEPTIGHAVFGHVDGHPEIYSVAKNRTANENRDGDDGDAVVRLARRHHGGGQPAHGLDPARRDDPALWRRHVLDQPGRRLYRRCRRRCAALSMGCAASTNSCRAKRAKPGSEYNERVKRRALESEHPLVTVHAETGERVLFVSPSFLKSIVGLTPRESQKILEILWEHVTRPEYTVRFKWNEGDIAFWDNRSTVHLAPTRHLRIRFRPPALSDHAGRRAAGRRRWQALPIDRGRADPVGGRRAEDDGGGRIASR